MANKSGLLDALFSNPNAMGLLSAGAGMLTPTRGGSFGEALSNGLTSGFGGYKGVADLQRQQLETNYKMQKMQQEEEERKRQMEMQAKIGGIFGKLGKPVSGAPTVENAQNPQMYGDQQAMEELRALGLPGLDAAAKFKETMPDKTKPMVVGRSLIDPATGKIIATDSAWSQEREESRSARQQEQQSRLDTQKQIAQMNVDSRMDIASILAAQKQQKNTPKLPATALKMQNEELESIGQVSAINADLTALHKQVKDGKLDLGPVKNIISRAKNYADRSDEKSRNFASFKATLEKQRNASLSLNKGTQTEGDAVRAWNEIMENINDNQVVKQRLEEIINLNQRAASLKKMNIDVIRQNYGLEELDTSGFTNQQPAVGGAPSTTQPGKSGWKIERLK